MSGGRELGETLLCMQCHGTMERRSLPSPTSLHHRLYRWWCLSRLFFGPCQVFSLAPRVDGARGGDGVLETHPTPLPDAARHDLEVRRQWRPAKDVPVMKIRNPAVPSHEPGRISIQEGDRHRKGSPRPLCLIPSPHPPPLCCPSSPKPRTSPPASIESTHTAKESIVIMSDSKNFETLQLHAGYVLPQARGNSFN